MSNSILQKTIRALKEGVLLKKLFNKCVQELYSWYWFRHTDIEKRKIIFLTFQGKYTCNPKYICNEIIRQGLQWGLVWVIYDEMCDTSGFPEQVRLVLAGTSEYFKELYSSHIWIDNAFCIARNNIRKRPEHIYIETMHGSLGIKRIGPNDVKDRLRNKRGYRCGKLTDYCISNSSFENDVYRTSFWKNTKMNLAAKLV